MKKRQERDVKTKTLVILLLVFGLLAYCLLAPVFLIGINTVAKVIIHAIYVLLLSILSSFMIVSSIAIILKWRI